MKTTLSMTRTYANGDTRSFELKGQGDIPDGSVEPSDRNQVLTAKSDHVMAAPYRVIFDNGRDAEVQSADFKGQGMINNDTVEFDGTYVSNLVPQFSDSTVVESSARLKAIATTTALARARQGAASLPIMLKELPQTINMIRDRSVSTLNAAIALQKRTIRDYYKQTSNRGRKKVYDRYANMHLEYLFGWATTYDEIQSLCDALSKPRKAYVTGKGKSGESDSFPGGVMFDKSRRRFTAWSDDGHQENVMITADDALTTMVTVRNSVKATLSYEIDIPALAKARDLGALSADALFDAVPMSFLLNFSSNTQDYLAALQPMVIGKYKTGCVTSNDSVTALYTRYAGGVVTYTGNEHYPTPLKLAKSVWKQNATIIDRAVLYSEPDPEWFLVNKLTLGKAITGAMIAIQQRGRVLSRLVKILPVLAPPRNP